MKVEKCLIDANWGNSTDVLFDFCRECGFGGVAMEPRRWNRRSSEAQI